jgi:hypothetical protein
MKIAVLGTGTVGDKLSNGFLALGHDVMRGSRDPSKLAEWKKGAGAKAQAGSFADAAAWGEIVVLAVKGSAAESCVEGLKNQLGGKLVIDTTNPIADKAPEDGVLVYFTGPNDSLMERLQKKVPDARFVKAFNSVGAHYMVNPKLPGGPPTMFICGNDAGAKTQVQKLLADLAWETADMGTAKAARAIEPLCMLYCIPGLARDSWTHAFKLLHA